MTTRTCQGLSLLSLMSPLLALFGRRKRTRQCPLLREERKSRLHGPTSGFDPTRTSDRLDVRRKKPTLGLRHRGAISNEAARVHRTYRRRGGGLADGSACAATRDTGGRNSLQRTNRSFAGRDVCVPGRLG